MCTVFHLLVLLQDITITMYRRCFKEKYMNAVFSSLSPSSKKWINENLHRFQGDRRRLQECFARVISRHEYFVEPVILAEVEKEIEKSNENARKRQESAVFSEGAKLVIYKGTVTCALLKTRGEPEIASDFDAVEWNEDYLNAVTSVKWKDIVILSAIYNLIECNEQLLASKEGDVLVTVEEVYNLINPFCAVPDPVELEEFRQYLDVFKEKIDDLHGQYVIKKNDDELTKEKPYVLNGDFFLGNDSRWFDYKGNGYFHRSVYMNLCERQKRLSYINTGLLKGDSLEENIIMSYIIYRNECKEVGDASRTIRYDTLNYVMGFGRWIEIDTIKSCMKKLKKIYKSIKLVKDKYGHLKITWDEKNNS